ncbi:Lrp/AsnC family transcriptional regulator [Radiobacillus deserti]|uniref:Lrp/AsnC family transcriptional regulator n=1 Tax=Radiobacillus deserti TaxID=2594883 RepID=A0A516KKG6_9BACI|nr:Lrp/AsnC family transcriptional regulator [Radiobacillus deserti]QDP41868.1 Lrp/AsnC family transcriptional regulator [Radiobacillus deserti]
MTVNDKKIEILELLEKDSRLEVEKIAKMTDLSVEETNQLISEMERDHIIAGYSTLIDWTKVLDYEGVTAMIDVKVTPTRGVGFDKVAERIYRFPEVEAVYLMSGAYDLSVLIEAKTMSDIGRFVSDKLSTLESVLSTTTHFVLKKYKHDGIIFEGDDDDKRIMVTP